MRKKKKKSENAAKKLSKRRTFVDELRILCQEQKRSKGRAIHQNRNQKVVYRKKKEENLRRPTMRRSQTPKRNVLERCSRKKRGEKRVDLCSGRRRGRKATASSLNSTSIDAEEDETAGEEGRVGGDEYAHQYRKKKRRKRNNRWDNYPLCVRY